MREEKGTERTTVCLWRMFAAVVAVALTVNAAQAVAGKTEFAWWHLPTLGVAASFGEVGDIIARMCSAARISWRRWLGSSSRKAIRTRG